MSRLDPSALPNVAKHAAQSFVEAVDRGVAQTPEVQGKIHEALHKLRTPMVVGDDKFAGAQTVGAKPASVEKPVRDL